MFFSFGDHSMKFYKPGIKRRIILSLLSFLFLFSSIKDSIGGDAEPLPMHRPVLSIGVLLPLSGVYAEYGEKILAALIMAGQFFEDRQDTPVKLIIEDSASDGEKARQGLVKLATLPDVSAVIGPLSSEESLSAANEAQKRGLTLLTLTRNESVTAAGAYIFNALPSARNQTAQLVRYTMKEGGLKRLAVLYPDTPSGRDTAEIFRDTVKKEGGRITHYIAYPDNDTDFSQEIENLVGKRLNTEDKAIDDRKARHKIAFEALFIPDSATRMVQILSQLSFYNIRGFQLLGQSGMNMPETLMMHRELFEEAIFVDGYFADGRWLPNSEFCDRFFSRFGREPDPLEGYAFDAMSFLLNMLRNSAVITREQLLDMMANRHFEGVRGRIAVNPSRVMDSEPVLITVRDGYPVRISNP
jgi:ABC-type branched-subunit amino acid transport system substrate-binding protein